MSDLPNPPTPSRASLESPRSAEGAILITTCAAHLLTHVYLQLYTAISPNMRATFGLAEDHFTACASVSFVLFGLGAMPTGWLSDRYGEKPLLVAFYLLTALGGTLIGIAQSTWQLVAGFAAIGIGLSIYHPVGMALITKGISRPSRALGINGLFGSIGTAAAPLCAGQITSWSGDWRTAYLALAVPTVLLGLWTATRPMARLERDRRTSQNAPGRLDADNKATKTPPGVRRAFFLLLCAMTCGGFYYSLTTTFLPVHLDGSGILPQLTPEERRGWMTFVVLLVGGVGQVASGFWVENREGRGLYAVVLCVLVPLLVLTALTGGLAFVSSAAVMAFFIFSVQPIENTLLSRYTPASLRGRAFGLKFIVVFTAGMGGGQWLSGILERHGTQAAVYGTAAGFATAALALAVLATRVRIDRG